MNTETTRFLLSTLEFMAGLFVLAIGLIFIGLLILYIIDKTQTAHAVRRNYPIVGRFRYLFEHMGEFFRQYFFAMDREEMPFNRAERSWVYRAAKDIDSTIAFGSTRNLTPVGSVLFANCPFPTLSEDAAPVSEVTIGPYCRQPYTTDSLFNISGMSYGALSAPAVRALSCGAKKAGCWMNTGEGGVSPHHLESGCDLVCQIGTAKYGVRDSEGNLSEEKLKALADYPPVSYTHLTLPTNSRV